MDKKDKLKVVEDGHKIIPTYFKKYGLDINKFMTDVPLDNNEATRDYIYKNKY